MFGGRPWLKTRKRLTREQVLALIGKHASRLAELARDHGFAKLDFRLHLAAKQAERDLEKITTGTHHAQPSLWH